MTDAAPTGATPDREAVRAELEATRTAFHDLLKSLSPEDWKKKSGNPAWSVGQLMWHIPWATGYVPRVVNACRQGKGFNPPAWLMDPVNVLITRVGSRGATSKSVAAKYDAVHAAIIACLEGVQDGEWQMSVRSFGERYTVESAFHGAAGHFREHEADIRKGLGRA